MKSQKVELYFFFIALAAIFILTFFIFLPFLSALAVAAVFAVIFYPLYEFLLRTVKWKGLTAGITVLLILIIVFVPLSFLGFLLFEQAQDLFSRLGNGAGVGETDTIDTAVGFVESQVNDFFPGFTFDLSAYLRQALNWITQSLGSIFTSTAQALLAFVIGIISLFYFLRDGEWFQRVFIVYSPLRDAYDKEIIQKIKVTINSVLKGSILVALIQGVLTGIGLAIFGISNAVLWGSIAAIGALIPSVGTGIVIIPAVLFLFFFSSPLMALGLLLWGIFVVGLIDNVLRPIFIGHGTRIHPLLILLAVLGGLSFFGPVGFLLGPIILSVLIALAHIYNLLIRNGRVEYNGND